MYSGLYAEERADVPAIIMADSGEVVTYRELEERQNRLAHLFRASGLRRLDHVAMFMENHSRYVECCGAAERSGLYYTCINSYLTADELAYIVNNCEAKVLITSASKAAVAREALDQCPGVTLALIIDAPSDDRFTSYEAATAPQPNTPIPDERLGTAMLYSSGTTGRPKGILRPLPDVRPDEITPLFTFLIHMFSFRTDGMRYLSPAPLYHSAPQASVGLTIRCGGTAVIMERFDPERYLQLVEQYSITHSQLVPTMFSRMLKLPDEVRSRYDTSSLEIAIHAAAPCPVQVKEQMIEWWGPIIFEYYGATEGLGFTACGSEEWMSHKGTVGKSILGEMHILDEDMNQCPIGEPGTVWFKTATPFEYFNDSAKNNEARSADGTMSTVGDVGYVDAEGYLYLTDRKTYMIISGGVNIYPQECENLLITHPKVADAAVFGVPNEDLGEEVKAVVQVMEGVEPGAALEAELIAFCREHLARQKVPALDRLRGRASTVADRQAVQTPVPRSLLGRQVDTHRLTPITPCQRRSDIAWQGDSTTADAPCRESRGQGAAGALAVARGRVPGSAPIQGQGHRVAAAVLSAPCSDRADHLAGDRPPTRTVDVSARDRPHGRAPVSDRHRRQYRESLQHGCLVGRRDALRDVGAVGGRIRTRVAVPQRAGAMERVCTHRRLRCDHPHLVGAARIRRVHSHEPR